MIWFLLLLVSILLFGWRFVFTTLTLVGVGALLLIFNLR